MVFLADLLYLLQWRDHPDRIQEALTRALRLNGEELVKFLQDILDALFSMFSTEDGNSTAHSGLVFHVLVSKKLLLGIIVERFSERLKCVFSFLGKYFPSSVRHEI